MGLNNKKEESQSLASFGNLLLIFHCSVSQLCLALHDPMNTKHAKSPYLSWSLRACSNRYPFSRWHPPTNSSSAASISSCLNLSQHQDLFQWVSSLQQVAKILELQFQPQSFQWISGLISFKTDWFDPLAVQGTFKSLLQHHSSRASVLQCSAFLWSNSHIFTWQLENYSFDYMDLCWQSNVSAF